MSKDILFGCSQTEDAMKNISPGRDVVSCIRCGAGA
jgi:hypothetical protein